MLQQAGASAAPPGGRSISGWECPNQRLASPDRPSSHDPIPPLAGSPDFPQSGWGGSRQAQCPVTEAISTPDGHRCSLRRAAKCPGRQTRTRSAFQRTTAFRAILKAGDVATATLHDRRMRGSTGQATARHSPANLPCPKPEAEARSPISSRRLLKKQVMADCERADRALTELNRAASADMRPLLFQVKHSFTDAVRSVRGPDKDRP